MNVTLKLPDDLVRKARHLALDENTSLSALVSDLLTLRVEEKAAPKERPMSLIEAMTVPGMPDWFYEKEFPLEDRKTLKHREFTFEPDED